MAAPAKPLVIPQYTGTVAQGVPEFNAPFQVTPYDNDVTLLYKWANASEVPIKLMIVRPRTPADAAIRSGTQVHVYESLPMIVQRLNEANEGLSSMYDIITGYNPFVTIDDLVMTYYDLVRRPDPNNDFHDLVNQLYRQVDNTITVDKFESQDDLQKTYDAWITQLTEKRLGDIKRLETIIDIQERLEEVDREEKIPFSPVVINSSIMSFSPTINGRPVTSEDGLDIFNGAVPSKYVPFIKFNDKFGNSKFRVYTGGKIENEPNYGITIIPGSDSIAKNTIYMTLWLGDPQGNDDLDLHNAPRESFFTVVYHLNTNYLTVESPVGTDPKKGLIRNENVAYQRTRDALPNLVFGTGKEIKVRGDFNIWGMDFDETSFLDMVLLEPLMNVYLYIEENIKPFALKKRLDVHYRSIYSDMTEGKSVTEEAYISNSASVSVTLTRKSTLADETVDVADPITKIVSQALLPAGTPYIHVNISQAESRNTVSDFIPIFKLLMRYYLDNFQPISDVYQALLPELAQLGPLVAQRKRQGTTQDQTITALTKKRTTTKRGEAKIKQLQKYLPALFIEDYARKCQCALQPIIVTPEEAEAWKQRRVGPMQEERQIMPYPANNPVVNFVCPSDATPYPGMKYNRDLDNKDTYPYLPCCFATDQTRAGENPTKYQRYLAGQLPPTKTGAKAEKKIITRKILTPNKIAVLPRAVETIVKRYSEEYIDMVRYGIPQSPNSLLHCVCTAIDDPNYTRMANDALREDYVTRIRQHIMATILPSMYRQELYDHTDTEIQQLLGERDRFLDPAWFYRGVEETFNVNIYVFTQPKTFGDDADLGSIDIPRFKIFHSRPLRLERPTVVIMKNSGSESDALVYPQCELIVDYDQDNLQIVKLFGPEMTKVCHETLQQVMKTMTWTIKQDNTFEVHANMYYHLDHLALFGVPAVSQFIDDNGKMRALTLNVGGQFLTIATVPSQPENLPVTQVMTKVDARFATQVFGEPSSVTRNAQGLVDGLWFTIMDITNGEFVSVNPTKGFDNKPIGPHNPILSSGTSVTNRISKMRRTLSIIIQLLRWLYDLARSKQNIDPTGFARQFMLADQEPVLDSSSYYDVSHISRRLPNVETIQEAIRLLEPSAPTLFSQGHIVMYSAEFADRMINMLKDYSSLRYGMEISRVDFLDNFFETESDFKPVQNSKVFMNETDMNSWLLSLKSSQNYSKFFNIRRKIEIAMGFSPDPYMYEDEDGKIYIIQNVVGGTKAKALAVANTWRDYLVNIGSEPTPLDVVPIHMVYGITPSSTLVPVEDATQGYPVFLKLVYYGTHTDKLMNHERRWGAMLEIL